MSDYLLNKSCKLYKHPISMMCDKYTCLDQNNVRNFLKELNLSNIIFSFDKKLVKSNKSISRKKFFDQIPFFAISKKGKNQFLNQEKVWNCQKCNFTKKKIFRLSTILIFVSHLQWIFLIWRWTRCDRRWIQ